jgi:ABC-type lipoprotein release transport system permease subunit
MLSRGGTLDLALRGLWRNPRRTGLTLLSTTLGVAALTLLGALNDGWLRQMRDNFILSLTGHLQIHAQGFEETQHLSRRIQDPAPLLTLLDADPAVAGWTPRVRASGLAKSATGSVGVQLMGVDPAREPTVTRLREMVREGRWLPATAGRELLLGATLATNLGLTIGDRVILTAQRPDGEMAAEAFRLRGILHAGTLQIDRTLALLPLATLQQWLELGPTVTDLALRTRHHRQADELRQRLAAALPADQYEVLSWDTLDPMVGQWLRFSDAYGLVLVLVVALLVLVQVLNTMLMALHERTRELGILAALGSRPGQLGRLVLLEGLLLILAGALLGWLLAAGASLWLARDGIDLSRFANAFRFFYMDPVIRPQITLAGTLRVLGTAAAAALLAGLYPAWKASRLDLQEALRRF